MKKEKTLQQQCLFLKNGFGLQKRYPASTRAYCLKKEKPAVRDLLTAGVGLGYKKRYPIAEWKNGNPHTFPSVIFYHLFLKVSCFCTYYDRYSNLYNHKTHRRS